MPRRHRRHQKTDPGKTTAIAMLTAAVLRIIDTLIHLITR